MVFADDAPDPGSIDSGGDHAPSTRRPGDSGFSDRLRPFVARPRPGLDCSIQSEPRRSRRGESDHGISDRVADGASRPGAGDLLSGGRGCAVDATAAWLAESALQNVFSLVRP